VVTNKIERCLSKDFCRLRRFMSNHFSTIPYAAIFVDSAAIWCDVYSMQQDVLFNDVESISIRTKNAGEFVE